MSANTETLKPFVGSAQGLVRNPLNTGGDTMKEYCNICGRKLLEDVLVVDTSLDMKPIKFKDVHGDKSDLICIECAIDSVENPPSYVQGAGSQSNLMKSSMYSEKQPQNRAAPNLTLKKHALKINTSAAHVFAR
ncbi:MAG: hypothetical protein NHB15_15280 [Methanosarcina barkeri]|nr:hypothetical protein [Methanosarcina sp. ERenArc_MAG2]